MVDSTFLPVEITYASFRSELIQLRKKVWTQSNAALATRLFSGSYEDSHDDSAYCWAVFDQGKLIAAARLSVHTDVTHIPDYQYINSPPPPLSVIQQIAVPIGAINRLVVDPAYQGRGLSNLLDEVRLERARLLGCKTAVGTTHGDRRNRLIAMGFTPICEVPSLAPPMPSLLLFRFSVQEHARFLPANAKLPADSSTMMGS